MPDLKRTVAAIILCILVGLILGIYIESQPKDSDLDGWTDVEEQEAGTSPFDSDTDDDDGIKDPEDPTPLNPGILTSDEQKLKDYKYVEYDIEVLYSWSSNKTHLEHIRLEDVRIPEGSTMIKFKETWAGYGEQRWCTYQINASALQVIDFFLRNMVHDGWHAYPARLLYGEIGSKIGSWGPFYFAGGISEMNMHFTKERYEVTIVVVGLEEDDYSQFTIVYSYPI